MEYKEDLAVGSCYAWKRRTRGEIERTRQQADKFVLLCLLLCLRESLVLYKSFQNSLVSTNVFLELRSAC
ncbi:MAG: hypothetical protein ACK55Z_21635 [bacterium]